MATIEQEKTLVVTTDQTPAISYDTTPTSGNVLIAVLATQSDTTPITAPTGFTLLQSGASGTNVTIAIAYKVSTGTEGIIEWTKASATHNTLYINEVSGLTGSAPTASGIDTDTGINRTSMTISTSGSANDGDFAMAFAGSQQATNVEAGRAWSDGYTETTAGGTGTTRPLLSASRKNLTATGVTSTTFSTTGSGDQLAGVIMAWAQSAGVTVDDINTDEVVEDGETGVTFTTTGYGGEISTATINDGTNSTSASNISSTGGAGTFDLPDVSGYASNTAGSPFTTASYTIQATLGDGTDTANLGVTYNPKTGWAVVEVASAVKTTGSVFENFVGTITDASQVLYPTSNNTSVSATGIITTDATQDIDMQFWDVTDGTWKPFTALIGSGNANVSSLVSSCVSSMVRSLVR